MTDDKPLRPEEYHAMAEELRQAKAENARLLAKPAKQPRKPFKWPSVRIRQIFGGVMVFAVVLALISFSIIQDHKRSAWRAQGRQETCYFASQADEAAPWDNWYVWRSGCLHCDVEAITHHQDDVGQVRLVFQGGDEAVTFIHQHHLPVCP